MAGKVEVDETLLGGVAEGARGRGSQGKALVAIAARSKPWHFAPSHTKVWLAAKQILTTNHHPLWLVASIEYPGSSITEISADSRRRLRFLESALKPPSPLQFLFSLLRYLRFLLLVHGFGIEQEQTEITEK